MGVRARCKKRSELEVKPVEDQSALRVPSGVRDRKVKRKKKRRSPVPQCRQGVNEDESTRVLSVTRDCTVKRKKNRRTPVTQCAKDVNGDEVAQPQERQERQPWPFTPDEADHCESPLAAYHDLRPFLDSWEGSGRAEGLRPVLLHWPCQSLGLSRVHNECEDFYETADEDLVPEFDILVTNPPCTATAAPRRGGLFGTYHIERLLLFCRRSCKPSALLMPNFVYTRAYFDVLTVNQHVSFLAPVERYVYEAPRAERLLGAGMSARDAHGHDRTKKTRTTAPFPSFWYLLSPKSSSGDTATGSPTPWWQLRGGGGWKSPSCRLHTIRDLPAHLRDGSDVRRGRKQSWERNEPKRSKTGKLLCSLCGQEDGNCKHTRQD